jgi:hypothetical protein
MTSNPSAKTTLRIRASEKASFLNAISILSQVSHLKNRSPSADRALVIQGTAMIERALEVSISEHFRQDMDPEEKSRLFGIPRKWPTFNIRRAHIVGLCT